MAILHDHIRIHALEGKLFREVVADAAAAAWVLRAGLRPRPGRS